MTETGTTETGMTEERQIAVQEKTDGMSAADKSWLATEFVTIAGLPIAVLDRAATAQMMCDAARQRPRGVGRPLYLTSANGEVLARCWRDPEMAALFLEADQIAADGQPMVTASRFLCRVPLPERVATTDLVHDVAVLAQTQGLSFYMLGATAHENTRAVAAMRAQYPQLRIAGHCHGYLKGEELERKLVEIDALAPDILWLAMGVPHEQHFMRQYGHRLSNVGVVKTSGGLFNFLSGKNARAPSWMQAAGLEWLWRIFQEPRRLFWRYLVTNPVAIYAMIRNSA